MGDAGVCHVHPTNRFNTRINATDSSGNCPMGFNRDWIRQLSCFEPKLFLCSQEQEDCARVRIKLWKQIDTNNQEETKTTSGIKHPTDWLSQSWSKDENSVLWKSLGPKDFYLKISPL